MEVNSRGFLNSYFWEGGKIRDSAKKKVINVVHLLKVH